MRCRCLIGITMYYIYHLDAPGAGTPTRSPQLFPDGRSTALHTVRVYIYGVASFPDGYQHGRVHCQAEDSSAGRDEAASQEREPLSGGAEEMAPQAVARRQVRSIVILLTPRYISGR